MILELIRLTRDPREPQFGVLIIDGSPSYTTLELPFIENRTEVSCIPGGTFRCFKRPVSKHLSADIGVGFELEKVPGRSDILIHVANVVSDLKGCIGIGSRYGNVSGIPAILGSREAYRSFMKKMDSVDSFTLSIDGFPFDMEDI